MNIENIAKTYCRKLEFNPDEMVFLPGSDSGFMVRKWEAVIPEIRAWLIIRDAVEENS